MFSEWVSKLVDRSGADRNGGNELQNTPQMKKHSISSSTVTGSSKSTPLASPVNAVTLDAGFLSMCMVNDCIRECPSDMAASLAEESNWGDFVQNPPQYRRVSSRRKAPKFKLSDEQRAKVKMTQNHTHPIYITLYRPMQPWPDGTLQILWKKVERHAFGLKGLDKYEAQLELNMDDLNTIEIESEIASKYMTGTGIEVHPNETTLQKIGSIACYLISSSALSLRLPQSQDVPPHLQELFDQLPNNLLASWRQDEVARDSERDEDSIQDIIYWRHNWKPSTSVTSYLWIEDMELDRRFRGAGLGLCLLEDACQRIANSQSWVIAAPPRSQSLAEYFQLMGFAPVSDTFTARWNGSPSNPKLEEILPSVPYTAQQSQEQGFQL